MQAMHKKVDNGSPPRKRTPLPQRSSKVEPKYRDRTTGQTWSGRGRMPRWLAARIEQGAKLEDFKI